MRAAPRSSSDPEIGSGLFRIGATAAAVDPGKSVKLGNATIESART